MKYFLILIVFCIYGCHAFAQRAKPIESVVIKCGPGGTQNCYRKANDDFGDDLVCKVLIPDNIQAPKPSDFDIDRAAKTCTFNRTKYDARIAKEQADEAAEKSKYDTQLETLKTAYPLVCQPGETDNFKRFVCTYIKFKEKQVLQN